MKNHEYSQDLLGGDLCFTLNIRTLFIFKHSIWLPRAFFPEILGWEKIINLTAKLGEINNIVHNKGSKIYPQNQVILDCNMPSISLKHKCLSIILTWVIVSHK